MGADALDLSPLLDRFPELAMHANTTPSQVAERIGDAEYVFLNKVRLSREILENAPRLRYVGIAATGTDNVDKLCAAEKGIAVTNIQGYCTQSVVEHVFGVLLALAHDLQGYRTDVRAGAWQRAQTFCLLDRPVRELSSMTLGIVGYGELGKAVAETAGRFGMDVLISARVGAKNLEEPDRTPFSSLLARADVISLHCPLTDATSGMIGRNELEAMKPDAILINTARGGLVDSAALVDALAERLIAAAAIDVLAEEPPVHGDPLLDYEGDNLILTPHIAWSSVQARQRAIVDLARNVTEFDRGGVRNRIV